jgi:transposase
MCEKKPPVMTLSEGEVEALLARARGRLESNDYQIIADMAETIRWLDERLEEGDTSLAKLRQMLFGVKSERTEKVFPKEPETPPKDAGESSGQGGSEGGGKRPGHGRNGALDYAGAQRVGVPYPGLSTGCPCPDCNRGKVYQMRSGQIIRIVGRPALEATIYEPERWRCNVCGKVFTAQLPPEAGTKKYDETAGSMLGLMKYGCGMAFNRLEGLQGSLDVPLPASTQWEIVEGVADQVSPAHDALVTEAAQGAVLHNDDTSMTVLSLKAENDGPGAPERKGVFTSGVVSVREGREVALFFTGRKHAGERLEDVLRRRAAELGAPIQMCDALTRNLPKAFTVILSNCLAHGRRRFVEQAGRFPDECRYVLERLAEVYRNDALCAERGLSPEERLAFHQAESGPVLASLRAWMEEQLAEKKVEPNSGLGQAMGYMLKRWEALTLFLRQAGAPLDNNIVERALKLAILHRKNSLFYRTENGARVGDILMSLIHTCRLNGVNPFDYLTALQKNAASVRVAPACWLPWNYHEQLGAAPPDTG